MTIKQHGGVFGRNPKFNSVEAESLTIAGNAVPDASTILVDGDIGSTVQGYDADTAKLDAAQTFTAAQTFNENIVMANTKGIDFSATGDGSGTATSELFDDYEEGTWTPSIRGLGTAGTYELQTATGTYTKVGNQVTIHCFIQLDTAITGGGTGALRIQGLPYNIADNNCHGSVMISGPDIDGNAVSLVVGSDGSNRVLIYEVLDNAPGGLSYSQVAIADIAATDRISFSLTYGA